MQVKRFFRDLGNHFLEDNVQDVGAMMAYYAVMAMFPMLIFVLSLAMLVLPADTVRQGLAMATETVPLNVRDLLTDRVEALLRSSGTGLTIVGAVLALWGAKSGAVSLMTALNAMFHKKETRSWLRRQLTATLVTLAVGVLVVIALSLLLIGPTVGHWITSELDMSNRTFDVVWEIGRWLGAGVLVMVVWAIVYKFLPNTDAPFRIFTPGAFAGVLMWLGISALFGLYLGHFNSFEATYGTLGGAIIFLTWLWLSNIALLVGAAINDIVADLLKHKSSAAAQLADTAEHAHAH
jgi:membrane protein